jgi:hypothetical protein
MKARVRLLKAMFMRDLSKLLKDRIAEALFETEKLLNNR